MRPERRVEVGSAELPCGPNPSVRPSRRRKATQRRIEPSEVPSETRFLALSNAEGLTTATLETVERRSAAVFYKSALQIRR